MTRRVNYRNAKAIQSVQTLEQVKDVLRDILRQNSQFKTNVTADYTTTAEVAHEIVICDNTTAITVTLSSSHEDEHRVTIPRSGTGAVTVETEGSETINDSSTLVISSQYDSPTLMYDEDNTNWVLV